MCKEHITAIKQVLRNNRKGSIPILHCLEHSNGTLKATDLSVMVEVKTPTIADGIWKSEALDYGFKDDTKETEWGVDDFPTIEEKKMTQEIELSGEDMAKIIRAMDFASKDMTRPALTGVAIEEQRVYGCDGYRLYRNQISNGLDKTIILPPECVKILKAVKADKKNWTLTMYDDDRVAFRSGNFTLHSRLIDATIPVYENLLKEREYSYSLQLDMKQIKAGKDTALMIDRDGAKVYLSDRNGENKILISEGVVKQDGTIGSPKNIEVVMPLTGGFKGYTMIDLAIMKQYKRKIVLRMKDNDNKPVYVEEIK